MTKTVCLGNVGRGVTQQKLSNSYKVHNLGNTEQRGNNQGPAAGSLQERPGTLLFKDLSAVEE